MNMKCIALLAVVVAVALAVPVDDDQAEFSKCAICKKVLGHVSGKTVKEVEAAVKRGCDELNFIERVSCIARACHRFSRVVPNSTRARSQ